MSSPRVPISERYRQYREQHPAPVRKQPTSNDAPSPRPTSAEQALGAIFDHLAQGDWGNAERVLNAYATDVANGETAQAGTQ